MTKPVPSGDRSAGNDESRSEQPTETNRGPQVPRQPRDLGGGAVAAGGVRHPGAEAAARLELPADFEQELDVSQTDRTVVGFQDVRAALRARFAADFPPSDAQHDE